MIITPLRKDLTQIKPRLIFGMSKKEFTYNLVALILGILFFSLTGLITNLMIIKVIVLIIVSLPIIIAGYIQINKQGVEKYIYNSLKRKYNSKSRYYKEENNFKKLDKLAQKIKVEKERGKDEKELDSKNI